MTDFPYEPGQHGCKPDLLDTRDIPLSAIPPLFAPEELPASYTDPAFAALKVEDQNGSSSCVGQTFSKYAEALDYYDNEHNPADLSAKFLYSRIALPGGGAYLRDACKVLSEQGCAPEALDPSYPADEARMTAKATAPEVVSGALRYKIRSFALVPNTVPDIKRGIFEGHAVGIGSNVNGNGWGYNAVKNRRGFVTMPKPDETYGGHAYLLIGWDDTKTCPDGTKGAFRGRNSWGTGWGLNGDFWLSYSDVSYLFTGWTIVDLPDELIDNARTLYQLVRDPNNPKEVYAVAGTVARHIANRQTLELGNAEPDRYWVVPAGDIPTMPLAEWQTITKAAEVHLDPAD